LADSSLEVEILRLPSGEGLPLPTPATSGAAGCDLCAAIDAELVIQPGEIILVPTGFAVALPSGTEAQVRPRSGLAHRHGITLPNAPGTIDADYRGEIKVILQNGGGEPFTLRRGDRIAQMVIAPVLYPQWKEVSKLDSTVRGAGGFGHTGRNVLLGPAASNGGVE